MAELAESARRQWLSSGFVRGIAGVSSGAAGCAIGALTGSQQGSTTTLVALLVLSILLAIAWPLTGWRVSWLALGAVMILLFGGVVTALSQPEWADALANGCLFLLFAASISEILVRRVRLFDDGADTAIPRRLVTTRTEVRRQGRGDYLIVGLVCGVATQTWTDLGSLLAFGDFAPLTFLNPDNLTQKLLPMWNTFSDGLGGRNFTVVNAPLLFLSRSMQEMGLPGWMAQRLILGALLAAQGLCMIYLLRTIWTRSKSISRVAGALFYVFNIQALFTVPGLVQMTGFVLLPLLTALMLKGFATGERKYVILFALSSLGLGYVAANPPLVLVVGFGALLIAIISYACDGGSLKSMGRFLVQALPLVLVLNLWWVVPLALSLGAGGATHIPVTPEEWEWTHVRNSVSNLYSLNSNWAWPQKIYYPYSDAYGTAGFQFGAFVPAGLAFGALATSISRRRPAIAWLCLASILLLFVGKGLHEPFREVNRFLLTEVPGMWVLREPASKLLPIVVIIFGILICACLDNALIRVAVAERRPSKSLWRGLVVFGVILPILAFPLLSGQFAWADRPVLPDGRVTVPNYWYQIANTINSDSSEGATLVLPLSDFYAMPYSWDYYGPDSVPVELIRRPTITGGQLTYLSYGSEELDPRFQAQRALIQGDHAKTRWLLRSLGVRYVLIRGDIDYEVLRQLGRSAPTPDLLTPVLDATPEFQLVDRAGPLSLYKVSRDQTDLVSAWSWFEQSDSPRLLPEKGSLYSQDLIATVESETSADEQASDTEQKSNPAVAKVSLPIRRDAEGVEPRVQSMELLWERLPPEELGNAHTYLRLRNDELRRLRFGVDDRADLRMPWGFSTFAEFWSTRANLISNSSFEQGSRKLPAWEEAINCGKRNMRQPRRGTLELTRAGRSTDGSKSLQLSAAERSFCVTQSVPVDPLSTYEISFDQAGKRGSGARFCVFVARVRGGRCLIEEALEPSGRWAPHTDTFVVPWGVVAVDVFLYVNPQKHRPSTVLYDNVHVRRVELDRRYEIDWGRIDDPRLNTAASKSFSNGSDGSNAIAGSSFDLDLPTVRITQASQSRFVVEVSDARSPFMLTLNQTFDPAWRLSTPSGESLDATHSEVNGYTNGWWVRKTGTLRLILDFPQERFAVLARWISLISIGMVLGLSAILRRREVGARLESWVRSWRTK
jgi:hypothetical protein